MASAFVQAIGAVVGGLGNFFGSREQRKGAQALAGASENEARTKLQIARLQADADARRAELTKASLGAQARSTESTLRFGRNVLTLAPFAALGVVFVLAIGRR